MPGQPCLRLGLPVLALLQQIVAANGDQFPPITLHFVTYDFSRNKLSKCWGRETMP